MRARVEPISWQPEVVNEYERALWDRGAMHVRERNGQRLPFDIRRWLRTPDGADESLLVRCGGPTVDIGCGPGRLVAALAARGIPVLGVDVAGAAVAITRARGGLALRRSVFDRLPGDGRWRTAVLADGNIGIGGDVGELLCRIRELLAPGGHVLIEVEANDNYRRMIAEVTAPDGTVLGSFPWARIGKTPLERMAVACGFVEHVTWQCEGRHFVDLRTYSRDVRER